MSSSPNYKLSAAEHERKIHRQSLTSGMGHFQTLNIHSDRSDFGGIAEISRASSRQSCANPTPRLSVKYIRSMFGSPDPAIANNETVRKTVCRQIRFQKTVRKQMLDARGPSDRAYCVPIGTFTASLDHTAGRIRIEQPRRSPIIWGKRTLLHGRGLGALVKNAGPPIGQTRFRLPVNILLESGPP